jgi:REP-associated tyrosine transposase
MNGAIHMEEHYKKLKRYERPNQLRFLTFSCYNRLALFGNDAIKDAFVNQIETARERTGFCLIAWVIMPEHVHMIVWPSLPEFPISRVTWWLKRDFARRVLGRWRELDAPILSRIRAPRGGLRFWQHGGGYDRNLRDDKEYREKVVYIHGNPVRRGLVGSPADWRWSSARWYSGDRSGLRIDPCRLPGSLEGRTTAPKTASRGTGGEGVLNAERSAEGMRNVEE